MIESILKNHYDLPESTISKFDTGSKSEVYKVKNGLNDYVLYSFKNVKDVYNECIIHSQLEETTLTSSIVKTTSQSLFVNDSHTYFILKTFIHGKKPTRNNPESILKISKSINQLLSEFSDLENINDNFDSFNLLKLYTQIDDINWLDYLDNLGINEETIYSISKGRSNDIIHGDLTLNNMIETNIDVKIIDFGEIRRGGFYFDIAGALSSSLEVSELNDKQLESLIHLFMDNIHIEKFVKRELMNNIMIWYLRGVLSLIINHHNISKTIIDKIYNDKKRLLDILEEMSI